MEKTSKRPVTTEIIEYSDEYTLLVDLGPQPDGTISADLVGSELIVVVENSRGGEDEFTVKNVPETFTDVDISVTNGVITVTSEKN